MPGLELSLLGPPRLEIDAVPLEFGTRKNLALVAYLAVTGESHPREELVTLLWPELEPSRARSGLRRNLSVLKKALGGEWLVVDRESVGLDPTVDLRFDVEEFQALLQAWQDHGHPEIEACPACLSALSEAVELYRGDFLAGFSLRDSPSFDEWQFFRTEGLRQELASALERLVRGHSIQGDYQAAIPHARRWVSLDSLHEPAHRHLMRLYVWSGQRAAAIRQYAECERILLEELGVPPEEATTRLFQAIKKNQDLPEPAARDIPSGTSQTDLLARYRLEAESGRDGSGVTYQAHDTLLDRAVTVKVRSDPGLGEDGRARAMDQACAPAGLTHPNIVTVYDVKETEGSLFVVLEPVDGPSLREYQPQDLHEILSIARQVCAALEHAHSQGIVHRDLKPESVLLSPGPGTGTAGIVKVTGFGLAGTMASRLATEGEGAKTVSYLAPELALGGEFDGRADLYALGVMLYELITGRPPFIGDDPLAVISQHLNSPAVPPRARDAGVPPALDALIIRLLNKDPQHRPASAAEVLRALSAPDILDREASPGRELSMLERIERGRLVARERELSEARALWQKARAGEGGMLLVSGEPGIGKTRLVRELRTEVRVAGNQVVVGECYAEGGAPYAPFAQILRRAFRNSAGDRLAAALPNFVLADLLTLAPSLRLRFPDVAPNPSLDPKAQQQRLFESVVALCRTLCDRTPLLLILEDAHWADSGSLALLRHLARRTRRQPLLLIATYREVELDQTRPFQEVLLDLNRERLATRLRLLRLDREGTRDMLAVLFAVEISGEFLDGIYVETEGNPFFVEEVCKALVESGQVFITEGAWDRRGMEELEIPQSVRVAIQSRVGRMPPACQDVLRLAAILGREFEFETLFAASEADEEGLIDALEAAARAQLVEEVSAEGDVVFAFTHALIPATLSEGVSTLRRRRLHRRAAAAVERLHPDDFEALAYHYGEAGDEARALATHIQAGERSSAVYANVEAEGHFRAALELVKVEAERADLLGELGRVLFRQSRYDETITVWQAGITQYQALGRLDGVARLYARAARAASVMGDWPRGLALCREGLAAVAEAPESPDRADLLHETARACVFNGLPDEAAPLCRQALGMAERLGAIRVQAEALTTLSILPGQPQEEALSALTRAVELAESEGLLNQAYRAHQNLGGALDDAQAAREHFMRALELARQRADIGWELYSACRAAFRSLQLGDLAAVEEVLPSLRQLQDEVEKTGAAARRLRGLEVTLMRYQGEVAEAIEGLQSLRREARAAGDLRELRLLNLELAMACIWEEVGEEEELEAMLQETLDLTEWAMWPAVLARCLLSVQRARQGEPEAARHLLAKAREQGAEHDSIMGESYQSWAEAHLAIAEGHWSEALAAFETAIDTLGRAKLRWYRARTLIDWAEAHLTRGESGDRERAQVLLSEAEAEFEAMGASIYAKQVKGRLEKLGAGSPEP